MPVGQATQLLSNAQAQINGGLLPAMYNEITKGQVKPGQQVTLQMLDPNNPQNQQFKNNVPLDKWREMYNLAAYSLNSVNAGLQQAETQNQSLLSQYGGGLVAT